jgi:predicted PurR-regulated permease PerM
MTRSRSAEEWLSVVWRLLLRVAITVALLYVVWRIGDIIVITMLALLVALAVTPLVDRIARVPPLPRVPVGGRRLLATTISFILVFSALFGIGAIVWQPFSGEMTAFGANFPIYQRRFVESADAIKTWFDQQPEQLRKLLAGQDFSQITSSAVQYVQRVVSTTIRSTFFVAELVLIPVLAFYFAYEPRALKKEFVFLLPRRRVREALRLLNETALILREYVVGQLILCVIAGVVVGLMLWGLGNRYSLALGVLAGITRAVPVIGPVLGAVPIVALVGLSQGTKTGLVVLTAFTVMHLIESKLIMPRIIGFRTRLHPAVVIVALLIGSEFFGLMGMFLAAPVAAIAKVLIRYYVIRPQRARFGRLTAHTDPRPDTKELSIESAPIIGTRHRAGAD